MVRSDMKEISSDSRVDENENNCASELLDYLCRCVGDLTRNADCYPVGEDLTIIFEDCSGSDFLDFLRFVEDYGIDLENVQIHSDGDGWVAVDLIIE